eukprot:14246147-Heterocapsa_arctica.AAC.1
MRPVALGPSTPPLASSLPCVRTILLAICLPCRFAGSAPGLVPIGSSGSGRVGTPLHAGPGLPVLLPQTACAGFGRRRQVPLPGAACLHFAP